MDTYHVKTCKTYRHNAQDTDRTCTYIVPMYCIWYTTSICVSITLFKTATQVPPTVVAGNMAPLNFLNVIKGLRLGLV